MSDTAPPPEPAPPPLQGAAITGVVAFAVVSWIVLGAYVLKLPSYFAAFILLWYWTAVGKTDFRQLPAAILGALSGLVLTWALKTLSPMFGGWGLLIGAMLLATAVFLQVVRWAPLLVNSCTLLFTTVAGIPLLMNAADFVEVGRSLLIGSAYLSLVAWTAITLSARLARTPKPG